jgi:hypothetical protein
MKATNKGRCIETGDEKGSTGTGAGAKRDSSAKSDLQKQENQSAQAGKRKTSPGAKRNSPAKIFLIAIHGF